MKTLKDSALHLATALASGDFPDELEPQYVAWLLRQLANQTTPEGWQLVPTEPTSEMAEAGAHARRNKPSRDPDSSREIWKSMLAVAPRKETP